ncbi:MAG: hypothetical protein K1X57_19010, partial [Gemmataceae bacterium]|nr:hypothetical protein [Gemmataceae bacterium]
WAPRVASDTAGNFVVSWTQDILGVATSGDVYAQRFLAGGAPFGGEFRVNTYTTNSQKNSSTAMDEDGDFVVVWESTGQDGSNEGIYGQRYTVVPQIGSVQINDGNAQRSMVNSLTVRFTKQVLFSGQPADAMILNGPNGQVAMSADLSQSTPAGTVVRLTFTGPGIIGGSLSDGNYTFIVNGNLILDDRGQNLDGDANGTFGGNYLMTLHRLFGDSNGDRTVDITDFLAFRSSFLQTANRTFDFNGDGVVDSSDFLSFRLRFLVSV